MNQNPKDEHDAKVEAVRAQAKKHPILVTVLVIIILWTFGSAIAGSGGSSSTTSTPAPAPEVAQAAPQPSGPSKARTLGQDAYLRLPGNDDPSQLICLAPNQSVYGEYTKALMAKDYQGILELSDEGLFCIHNGSEVKVIDTGVGYTKVRVIKGAADIDADKVGESGWSASEWVLDR